MPASADIIWLCDGAMCREICICRDASIQGLVSQSACTVALHDSNSSMPFKRTFNPKNDSMLGFILWDFDELTFCYNFSKSVCFCARSLGTPTRKVLWQQKKHFSLNNKTSICTSDRFMFLSAISDYVFCLAGNTMAVAYVGVSCGLSWWLFL